MGKLHPSGARMKELCPRFENNRGRDTKAADEGKMLHKAIETKDFSQLEGTHHRDAVANVLEYVDSACTGGGVCWHELPLEDDSLRGTADLVWLPSGQKQVMHLFDWKFGRKSVDDAGENLQIQSYVKMLYNNYPECEAVVTHIVAPFQRYVSTHTYMRKDLAQIEVRLMALLGKLERCKEDESYGYQPCEETCLWCGKKATCPALCTFLSQVGTAWPTPTGKLLDLTAPATPEMRANRQILAGLMETWAESAKKANTAAVIEDGVEIPGFRLMKRSGSMKIRDTGRALDLVGLSTDHFIQACSVSLPKLSDVVAGVMGISRGDAREELEQKLKDVIEKEQDIVYLQRAKEKKAKEVTNGN